MVQGLNFRHSTNDNANNLISRPSPSQKVTQNIIQGLKSPLLVSLANNRNKKQVKIQQERCSLKKKSQILFTMGWVWNLGVGMGCI